MRILVSMSDDHQEWETFGLNCCKVAGVDVNSVIVKNEGEILLVFNHNESPPDQKFSIMEGLLSNFAKNAKCKIPPGWRFDRFGLDKQDYLCLGPRYIIFAVKYKRGTSV